MLYLANNLAEKPAVAFCGALSGDLIPLTIQQANISPDSITPQMSLEEFSRHQIPSVISTDDGSLGFRGYITQALEQYLDTQPPAKPYIIYTCGPEGMMKRVADIAISRGIECQVAAERAMACGMGTCQSCVIRVKNGSDWVYKLACTDGPVFRASDLLW